jgi:hypothetical protein
MSSGWYKSVAHGLPKEHFVGRSDKLSSLVFKRCFSHAAILVSLQPVTRGPHFFPESQKEIEIAQICASRKQRRLVKNKSQNLQ